MQELTQEIIFRNGIQNLKKINQPDSIQGK